LEKRGKWHLAIPQVFMVAKPIHNKKHFSKSESGCALLWKNGKNAIYRFLRFLWSQSQYIIKSTFQKVRAFVLCFGKMGKTPFTDSSGFYGRKANT
jgi:hypothetical protein